MKLLKLIALPLLLGSTSALAAGTYSLNGEGVTVMPEHGPAKVVKVGIYGDNIFRVTALPDTAATAPDSLMVVAKRASPKSWQAKAEGDYLTITAPKGRAQVSLDDGSVRFFNAKGEEVLSESKRGPFTPVTNEDRAYVSISQQFNPGTDEGFFGLGQHQQAVMNYNGKDVELAQHNMDIAIPFVISTKNYGLLWDNNGISRFGNPRPYSLLGRNLKVEGEGGKPGFTAKYYLGDRLAVQQQESTINYQYIRDQAKWPEAAKTRTVAATGGQNTAGNAVETQHVVWTGKVTPDQSGVHKFRLYASSYFKLFANGQEVLSGWRQNWNPWYHDFDLPMEAGKPVDIRIEWEPNAGYIALEHSDPLPDGDRHSLWMSSELAHSIDYYAVLSDSMDGVISGYRQLTGKASMMPKWSYGFWQSRQRYDTQKELVDVVKEYRKLGIPLDNIVLDWRYWRDEDWGSHKFDATRFPDPKKMVDDVHGLNARFMISVWPKFYPTTDNYKELAAKGYTYTRNLEAREKDWVGPGYLNTDYDPYVEEARRIYWRQIKDRLAVLGVDAWWMDATEPDIHSNLSIEQRAYRMGPTALGPGAEFFNTFPLVHAEGVYKGQSELTPDVRPFILTRSGYGGIQRAGSALWSGDVVARWDDLKRQISAGVNISMSGIPNWTHDIGGFAVEDRYTNADPAHIDEWRELNLRWFQFGAFSPLFRSHGEAPKREIYEIAPEGSPMRESMVWYTQLRYRLMPYIYTVAADTHYKDGSIMRGLVMDFPQDRKAWDINDEYLFGPSFLVAPVTEYKTRSRQVYLPAGADWYDFATNALIKGGQTITADAPYERMPLYVKAGSIVPTGPVMQYVDERPDAPLTIMVYSGADGSFSLYEDDGVSRQFEKGAASRIPMRWDDRTGTLSIGKREGSYKGMPQSRTFNIRIVRPGRAAVLDSTADISVRYDGKAQKVKG